jgi:hypothetical protein
VLDRPSDGGCIASGPVHAEHGALAHERRKNRSTPIPAARIDGNYALDWFSLLIQRVHQAREPRGAVVSDDHRGHHVLRVRVSRRQEIRLLSGVN